MSASSWCSLGWPNFPDPPDDHLIALETNATRSGEFGSIRLKSLAKCSRTNTNDVITQLKGYHVIAAEYRYYRLCEVGKCWICIILCYFIDIMKLVNIMQIVICFSFCHRFSLIRLCNYSLFHDMTKWVFRQNWTSAAKLYCKAIAFNSLVLQYIWTRYWLPIFTHLFQHKNK